MDQLYQNCRFFRKNTKSVRCCCNVFIIPINNFVIVDFFFLYDQNKPDSICILIWSNNTISGHLTINLSITSVSSCLCSLCSTLESDNNLFIDGPDHIWIKNWNQIENEFQAFKSLNAFPDFLRGFALCISKSVDLNTFIYNYNFKLVIANETTNWSFLRTKRKFANHWERIIE